MDWDPMPPDRLPNCDVTVGGVVLGRVEPLNAVMGLVTIDVTFVEAGG